MRAGTLVPILVMATKEKGLNMIQDELEKHLAAARNDNARQARVIKEQAEQLQSKDGLISGLISAANETIKAISQQMAQALLAMSERDKLRKELDNELCVNKNLIDELVMAKKNPATPGKLDLLITKDKGAPSWRKCTKRPVTVDFRDAVPGEVITTIDGTRITMTADHMVMRGTRGELYPITKAIFHETYYFNAAEGTCGECKHYDGLKPLTNKCAVKGKCYNVGKRCTSYEART